jgi:ubiquinone/menaquinone biosynthesis C-methylase UbiE
VGLKSAFFAARYDSATRFAETQVLGRRRAALLSGLQGRVIDVGAGTGANLPHFPPSCTVTAVEPDPHMRKRLEAKLSTARADVTIDDGAADRLPAEDSGVDAVVYTLVLCTVPDQASALAEARRVLKPGGKLLFLEHVRGFGAHAKVQDLVRPVWHFTAQGCNPNRDTVAAMASAGFTVQLDEEFFIGPKWQPLNPLVMGTATAK